MDQKRILIVEDEGITALYEKECLESLGHKVVGIVSTGEEAIKIAEKELPDLILMDITLAGEMDGIQAAWQIRDKLKLDVIFVTARGVKAMEPAIGLGYIVKPFDASQLQKHLENVFERKS